MDQSKEAPRLGKKRKFAEEECRLGQIYATDALSFLNHFRLERCRWVSRHYNGLVRRGKTSGKLRARECFDAFSLKLVEAKRTCHPNPGFDTDGFGTLSSGEDRDWRTVTEYHHCCNEWLSTAAPALAGQMIFPSGEPTAGISFSFGRTRYKDSQRVTLSLRNQLSPASAATLLHFIRHTEELYFDRVTLPRVRIAKFGPLNPAVLSAVVGNRGAGWIRSSKAGEKITRALVESRPITDAMKGMVVFGGHARLDSNFTAAFDDNVTYFITQCGGYVAGEVVIDFYAGAFQFPRAMGFFERLVERLSELEDPRRVARRVLMKITHSRALPFKEENSATPLLELLSTAWSGQPEITENVEMDRTEYKYRYSRLVGRSTERRQRVDLVVWTRRAHEKVDGTRNEVEIADRVEVNVR